MANGKVPQHKAMAMGEKVTGMKKGGFVKMAANEKVEKNPAGYTKKSPKGFKKGGKAC